MTEDKIKNLLQQADKAAGGANPVKVNVTVIRRRAGRKNMITMVAPFASAAVLMVALGILAFMFRTIEPTEEQKKLARDAYVDMKKAEKYIKAGVTPKEVMSKTDGHFGGHGLGISCFERPYIMHEKPENRIDDNRPFEVGTCIILGAHTEKEGVGGVKMEDHSFVTENGVEIYSTFPRGPFVDAAMEGYE